MPNYISLKYGELAIASLLVLIDAGLSLMFRLGIHRSLVIAAVRMTFSSRSSHGVDGAFRCDLAAVTGLAVLAMILFAGHEVLQRQSGGFRVGGLRPRHRLHDDGIGPGDDIRLADRPAANSMVRPALCDTLVRYDPR